MLIDHCSVITPRVSGANWQPLCEAKVSLRGLITTILGIAIQAGLAATAQAVTPVIVSGAANGFAIDSDGDLYGWGNDSAGQLGIGRKLQSPLPFQVGTDYKAVSTRAHQTFAFKTDGTLWGWGANMSGQLGDGTTTSRSIPVQIGGIYSVVSAGDFHTDALKPDGSLWAWGANESGQLGDGTYTDSHIPKLIGTGYSTVLAAWRHTVAIKADGTLWAWGYNAGGQLGDGTTTFRNTPVQVGDGFIAIAAGDSHTVALKPDGSLWTWGFNRKGQLGDGTTNSSLIPKQIGTGYMSIMAIKNATIALKTDGALWAWGDVPGPISSYVPVQIGSGFVNFSAGKTHIVALKGDGSLWAWGINAFGQFGNGTANNSTAPVPIGSGYSAISTGDFHTAALKGDGSVWTWGSDSLGQLGDGIQLTEVSHPVAIGTGFLSLAVGGGAIQYVSDTHVMALTIDGSLWAWGSNNYGQLGDGTVIPSSIPKKIGDGYSAVTAGLHFTIALKNDGSLWGWGTNRYGMLGNEVTNTLYLPPVKIGDGFKTVCVGGEANGFTLAIKTDGALWAWGSNSSGQLGDGTTNDASTPKLIGSDYLALAAGNSHTMALKSDGTLWAWGYNGAGQLGDGTTIGSLIPKQIGDGYSAVTAGLQFTAALKKDGNLWAWGRNDYGQLGDGSTLNSLTPKIIGSGYSAVSAGVAHIVATKPDGSVLTWGRNGSGQLGDGTFVQRVSPALVVNTSVDGFLNLNAGVTFEVPPALGVPFFVVSKGGISDSGATVSTTTKFNAIDVGKSGAVFVTAVVPSGSLTPEQSAIGALDASSAKAGGANGSTLSNAIVTDALAATPPNPFVLVQLTSAGWQPVVNGQLIPYASGVLGDQVAAQNILDGTDTTNLKGAQFCLGYGTSAERMITLGTMRVVASIPDPNASAASAPTCIVAGPPVSYSVNLPSGWNLLGNSLNQSLTVASLFSDTNAITSVWKWDATTSGWQFYTPLMDAAALQTYAASKGYAVLSTINPGEGYWVNAKAQPTIGAQAGDSFILTGMNLAKGWNLVATGNDITPTELNTNLKASAVPTSLTTLWAWDNPQSAWYFYAPSLETRGGTALTDYIVGKGYLDFNQRNKTLGNGTGFWVNR